MNDNTEVAEQVAPWKRALIEAHDRFVAIADKDRIVDWARESMFALQALERSDYLRKIASTNMQSMRDAIINVAACGITLNPAAQYAALVPRDGRVCLDIMYRGLIKIATDAGSIRWAQAELVYETDNFDYMGKCALPIHKAKPFAKDRGGVIGVYCIAKTVDGDVLVETMSADEVAAIRDRSSAWKAWIEKHKSCPWVTDPGEMMKKTVIKRARKTWPESKSGGGAERLQVATELANVADGYSPLSADEQAEIQLEELCEANADTIRCVKENIAAFEAGEKEKLSVAAEAWYELPQEIQQALWVAPTRNVDGKRVARAHAPFTTREREVMRFPEFTACAAEVSQ